VDCKAACLGAVFGLVALTSGGCGDDGGTADGVADGPTTDASATATNPGSDGSDGSDSSNPDAEFNRDNAEPGFSDEFNDGSTLPKWTRAHEAEGTPALYSTLDVDDSSAGALTMVPTEAGWFADFQGPLLFKVVSGDFIVETSLVAGSVGAPQNPPSQVFNSAGLLVRDPDHGPQTENWIMHNLGFQADFVGSEGKNTVESVSQLTLIEGSHQGRIRVCRVGDRVILAREFGPGEGFTATHEFNRPDFPAELQVGLIVNGWNSMGSEPDTSLTPDLRAEFDYIRLWRPGSAEDCVVD